MARYRFPADGTAAWAAFVLLVVLLAAALLQALHAGYPFWALVGAWALLILVAPEFINRILPNRRSRVGLLLTALLFVAYLLLGPARPSVTDLSSALWALPGAATVFVLCLITLLVVNERGNGYMVRQFLLVATFLGYLTTMLVQGPIDYYLGMLLDEDLVPGNTEFMTYLMIIAAAGLAMAYLMSWYLRRRSRSVINPGGVDWGR